MAADAVDEAQLRDLIPGVLAALVHRGADFTTAEDAVQEALVRAIERWGTWSDQYPDDPKGWLITTAWRRFVDLTRSDAARHRREVLVSDEPAPGPTESVDDTLQLYFLCAHPSLTPASAVALTLRAVGGLTTRQIAQAYLVPEATMAQRISRAKRTVSDVRLDRPGDLGTVLRVLYLAFNEGYSGDVDLAAEAIRLARQLAATIDDPEVAGLLALFLLHDASARPASAPTGVSCRCPIRTAADGGAT
jgi:RNA polymerase sigma factor (sigma-70 family)